MESPLLYLSLFIHGTPSPFRDCGNGLLWKSVLKAQVDISSFPNKPSGKALKHLNSFFFFFFNSGQKVLLGSTPGTNQQCLRQSYLWTVSLVLKCISLNNHFKHFCVEKRLCILWSFKNSLDTLICSVVPIFHMSEANAIRFQYLSLSCFQSKKNQYLCQSEWKWEPSLKNHRWKSPVFFFCFGRRDGMQGWLCGNL